MRIFLVLLSVCRDRPEKGGENDTSSREIVTGVLRSWKTSEEQQPPWQPVPYQRHANAVSVNEQLLVSIVLITRVCRGLYRAVM